MTTQTSLARQFAKESADEVVPANIKTIRNSKRVNLGLLAAAIGCTYWHQAHFLSGIEGFGMTVAGFDVNFGYVAPLIWDVAMVANANILQTPAMHATAKHRAIVMMLVAGVISMAVNLIAPGAWMARILFAVLVGVAVGQKWAGAAIKPDFKALEGLEVEAAVQAAPEPVIEAKRCPADCPCKRHPRNRKGKPRTPRQRKPVHAPVSPAPGGRMVDGVWQHEPVNA